jgi:hypothetical protein
MNDARQTTKPLARLDTGDVVAVKVVTAPTLTVAAVKVVSAPEIVGVAKTVRLCKPNA